VVNLKSLISHVKKNCNISDAKYWGHYSICGLLLRLRELYRFEKGIRLWESINHDDISDWISERENLWKELEDQNFEDIIIDGSVYSPFEVEKINAELEKEDLLYGAGYGVRMKPSFFLADLISKRKVNSHVVYIAGNEYVRDLAYYPATLQDDVIYARADTTKALLWEWFEEMKVRSPKSPVTYAFSKYGATPKGEPAENIDGRISEIAFSELETYIHHEIGEAFEGKKLGEEWDELLIDFSGSRAEFFSRGVKDLLSDTSDKGMIKYIIENQREGSLGFYIVFLSGYRKILFTEIVKAFDKFTESGDWELIEDARKTGYEKAKGYAERLLSLNKEKPDKAWVSEYIEKEMLGKEKAVKL
jgi:hypothetical protein